MNLLESWSQNVTMILASQVDWNKKIFWPILDSSFNYKSAKNENKINLASRTEEACSMNIQSKNQLDSPKTFLVIVVTVSKRKVLRNTRLKLSVWFIMYKKCPGGTFFAQNSFENPFLIVHKFEKSIKKKFDFLERIRWKFSLI